MAKSKFVCGETTPKISNDLYLTGKGKLDP